MSSSTSSRHNITSAGGTRTGRRSVSSTRRCWQTTGGVSWTSSKACLWVTSCQYAHPWLFRTMATQKTTKWSRSPRQRRLSALALSLQPPRI